MNTLDLIVLLPVGFFTIRGFRKGLVIELFTLAGLIIGVIGSLKISREFIYLLPRNLQNSSFFVFFLYLGVFMGIFILVWFAGRLVEMVLKVTQLNFINRFLGALSGLIKILFILSLFFWLSDQVNLIPSKVRKGSFSYPFFEAFAPWVIEEVTTYVPSLTHLTKEVEQSFNKIRNSI